jgi:hypothetical protein
MDSTPAKTFRNSRYPCESHYPSELSLQKVKESLPALGFAPFSNQSPTWSSIYPRQGLSRDSASSLARDSFRDSSFSPAAVTPAYLPPETAAIFKSYMRVMGWHISGRRQKINCSTDPGISEYDLEQCQDIKRWSIVLNRHYLPMDKVACFSHN